MKLWLHTLLLCLWLYPHYCICAETDEVQVLIDVSGSMKQNDPNNLRVDAAELLIDLLPDSAKVSLWLFAEDVKLLSHTDALDSDWRKTALKSLKAIHSRGAFTNIERALETATGQGFGGTGNKNLILLTDGMVDISKDIMVSADSRERILSEGLPRLIQRGIKINTIALSDQADKPLLHSLAYDSGGWNEIAVTADQLQRAFLKMAQKAAPRDTVPLTDNRFTIDGSIREFSVLVFKQAGANPTRLIDPDRQSIDSESKRPNVAWLANPSYDLITVKQPALGSWQIQAAIDPDNQVMILTDLQLVLEGPGNFVSESEAVPLTLSFTEQGQLISRADFLQLISLSVAVDEQAAAPIPASAGQAGFFSHQIPGLSRGKHRLHIVADGKTFQRELNRDIEAVAQVVRLEKSVNVDKRQVGLTFQPDIAVLDVAAMSITAHVQKGEEAAQSQVVTAQNGIWQMQIEHVPTDVPLHIRFDVTAKTLDGNAISPTLPAITIDESWFASASPASVATDEKATPPSPETQTEPESVPAPPMEAAEATTNWAMVIGIVTFANLLLFGIGYAVYRALNKSNLKKQQQLLEKLT
ncbi:VWA domain-containing protein [Methylomonas sp. HYX-M1]|uniref:VWA domain-containing protein n=1 Tax=Methylomonas sp. HYX-M1 TaxID=3139307 RepID=UPI00345C4C8A